MGRTLYSVRTCHAFVEVDRVSSPVPLNETIGYCELVHPCPHNFTHWHRLLHVVILQVFAFVHVLNKIKPPWQGVEKGGGYELDRNKSQRFHREQTGHTLR